MGGDDQAVRQAAFGFAFVKIIGGNQPLDIGNVKIIFAMFNFLTLKDIAIGLAAISVNIPDALDLLEEHGDPFQAIG